jgi:osmoprotectant transport system permease protein
LVETLAFMLHNLPAIGQRTVEHLSIVSVAVGVAVLTGVPLGIAITQSKRAADTVLYLGSIVMTIPFDRALRRPDPAAVEDRPGHRLAARGDRRDALRAAAHRAQHLYRDPQRGPGLALRCRRHGHVRAAAALRVEIPIAMPVIIAGVRIAVVINIGVTAIAAYIGAGGLGTFISRGISQTDVRQLITGAVALAVLAIIADYALWWLQRRLTPRGLGPRAA